jgi:hypothetical protein
MVVEKKLEEKEDNDRRGGQPDSRRDTVELVKRYTDLLQNAWQAPKEQKEQEFRRLKLAIKCQLALSCPSPLVLTLLERDDSTENTEVKSNILNMSDDLKKQIASAAKKLGFSANDTIVAVLSEHISSYAGEENGEETANEWG